jgi:hypothetical protein
MEAPKNLNEQLFYTQNTLTGTLELAETYDAKGKLTQALKDQISTVAEQAHTAIVAARSFKVQGKPEDSLAALKQAKEYIAQLEKLLQGIK